MQIYINTLLTDFNEISKFYEFMRTAINTRENLT